MKTLAASCPHPAYATEIAQFGRFVGQWDLLVTWYDTEGNATRSMDGEWEFAFALEGRAVIDVWQVPPRAQRDATAVEPQGECGMSVRFYDHEINAWRSTWHGPVHGVVFQFIAQQKGDDMVLERCLENGQTERWSFTEITDDSFHWLNQVSNADGDWHVVQDMRARRRH
jgi:hypothetical protein